MMKMLRRGWKISLLATSSVFLVVYLLKINLDGTFMVGRPLPKYIDESVRQNDYEVDGGINVSPRVISSGVHQRTARPNLGDAGESTHRYRLNKTGGSSSKPIGIVTSQKQSVRLTTEPKDSAKEKVAKIGQNVSLDVCRDAHLLPPRSRPLMALASLPGSGNTWVRYLLERASGIYTGSVYMDRALYDGGFKGEFLNPRNGRTLIVKTHDTGNAPSTRHYKGAVLIVRNPYNALLSYANLAKAGHTGWASKDYFKSEQWDRFVKSASISWEDRITTWMTRPNVLVVFYEQLKADLRNQIVRILDFLRVPVDKARLDCTVTNAEGAFHRKQDDKRQNATSKFVDPYQENHKAIIEGHIRSASKVLRKNGHIDYDLSYPGLSS